MDAELEEKEIDVGEKEYQDEFNRLAEGGKPGEAKAPDPKPETKDPEKPEPEPEAAPKPAAEEPEPKKDEGKPEPETKPDTGTEKALKDTKAWATKLAQENADLKKLVASQKRDGGASDDEIKKAEAKVGDARKMLSTSLAKVKEDYPELVSALDPLVSLVDSLTGKFQDLEKKSETEKVYAEQRAFFETEVEPVILETHPDFRKVAFSKEFVTWLEVQTPAMQFAASRSLDPKDICGALTEFKKFKASDEGAKAKSDEKAKQEGIRKNLSSMRGGGSSSKEKPATKPEELDPNDREGAFEFWAKREDKTK